jgi:hypothetical protein
MKNMDTLIVQIMVENEDGKVLAPETQQRVREDVAVLVSTRLSQLGYTRWDVYVNNEVIGPR